MITSFKKSGFFRGLQSPTIKAKGACNPNLETGKRYREAILEAGGSRPALASFIAFRGREPSLNALLRHQGMSISSGTASQ
jgi:oligopeptidase A